MSSSNLTNEINVPISPALAGFNADAIPRHFDFGTAGIVMTSDEFDAVTDYDECYRYELIRGVLVVNPIPSGGQAAPNELLGNLLFLYQQSHPQGSVLDATLQEQYVHGCENRRIGDRVIWAGLGRKPILTEDVPTIVVEFVSESRRDWLRDYVEKRQEYCVAGVKEYWVIDRFQRHLTVYRNDEKGESEIVVLAQEVYQTALLPGFELPLERILAMADAWSPPK